MKKKQQIRPKIHKKLVGKDKKMRAKVYKTYYDGKQQRKALRNLKLLQSEENGFLEADENEE